MIRACYSGDESTPEPFRLIPYNSIREVIPNMYMMADLAECQDVHPLGRWHRDGISQDITLYIYKFQTILTSSQLGVLCRLPVKEFQGYYVDEYVEFDVAERNRTAGERCDSPWRYMHCGT